MQGGHELDSTSVAALLGRAQRSETRECLALMVSAAVVAGSRHHACTNQGTVKRLGSTAKGKNAKYTGVLSLTHTRELAVAPIGYPVAGTREFY